MNRVLRDNNGFIQLFRGLVVLCGIISLASNALAQVPVRPREALPSFEVASVRSNDDRHGSSTERLWGDTTSRVILYHIPIKYVLLHAFAIDATQLKGPEWLDDKFYDILATVPTGTSREQVLLMFQALLIHRFHLNYHWESRPNRLLKNGSGQNSASCPSLLSEAV